MNIPKGSMCIACKHLWKDCSHMKFKDMQPIKKHADGYVEVKCLNFERG